MPGPAGSNLKFSENHQDFFVLEKCGYKQNGYFVDIGAADGITGSNTFLLEKFYKWNGICVDPNPVFLQSLYNCRDNFVSTLAVYSETGSIVPFKFLCDSNEFYGWNFRSGITKHLTPTAELNFQEINVLTVSLNDLLKLYNAPTDIDYISIDTEGSEFEILKTFDFEKYNVKCFTIEHSNEQDQRDIWNLLTSKGYTHVNDRDTKDEEWYFKNNRN